MNLEQIRKAFPIGSRVRRGRNDDIFGQGVSRGTVGSHVAYPDGRYYMGIRFESNNPLGAHTYYWPDDNHWVMETPLTPFQQDVQAYIDEEMRAMKGAPA